MLPLVRGSGRAVAAMWVMVLGLLGNIGLDWLFIHQFQWGLGGAAFATALAQGLRGGCGAGAAVPQGAAGAGRTVPLTVGAGAGNPALWNFPFWALALHQRDPADHQPAGALRYGGTRGVAVYAVLSYVLGSVIPLVSGVGTGSSRF